MCEADDGIRRQYIEQRAAGDVVHVEVAPGVVIVVAAWMLDSVACAGMGFGAPRVAVSELVELHHQLIEGGLRRSSRDWTIRPSSRGSKMKSLPTPALPPAVSRQLSIPFDAGRLRGMSPSERGTALARLAGLLLAAIGVAAGEHDDDER